MGRVERGREVPERRKRDEIEESGYPENHGGQVERNKGEKTK